MGLYVERVMFSWESLEAVVCKSASHRFKPFTLSPVVDVPDDVDLDWGCFGKADYGRRLWAQFRGDEDDGRGDSYGFVPCVY